LLASLAIINGPAATRYVNVANQAPAAPYNTWATAAVNIQDAIDAAAGGDDVLVTNGVYATGGRAVYFTMTNRVVVNKALLVHSVNGARFTIIQGHQSGTTNGPDAIRCVYLTNGAALSGFTVTNGATHNSGAFYFEESGGGIWGADVSAAVSNCVIAGNSAAYSGGGAYGCSLHNCAVVGNFSGDYGGGVNGGSLSNCTVVGNLAAGGGGAVACNMYNSIIYFNLPDNGEICGTAAITNCCTTPMPCNGLNNLTVDPQLASQIHLSPSSPCRASGRASYASGVDLDDEAWATPPSIGCDEYHSGSITGLLNAAIQIDNTNVLPRFTVNVAAVIAGHAMVSYWDFGDGTALSNRPYASHAWAAPGDYSVALHVYNETYPGGVSATSVVHVAVPAVHYVAADSTNPVPPYFTWATAATNIQDGIDAAHAYEIVLVTNGIYGTGGRAVYGQQTNRAAVDKPITVRSVNGPQATIIQGDNAGTGIRCVYLTNDALLSGFTLTNGAMRSYTGTNTIEASGGGLWCSSSAAIASNCIIVGNSAASGGGGAFGGTLFNCVLSGNSAQVGGGAAFGSSYGNIAVLNNCLLTTNVAIIGGGVSGCTLNRCKIIGNFAQYGGGSSDGTLNNCLLIGNSATNAGVGGGASRGTLNNCTLVRNHADNAGGGAESADLTNCIIFFNTAPVYSNGSYHTINYCCTTNAPPPVLGVGNITLDPLFLDLAGGNLRLQSNSPCINAGNNAAAPGSTDLDGRPRIVSGTVDMGAYEFQPGTDGAFLAWLQSYGLPTDGSADYTDPDGDRMNNWQEWICGTTPTNSLSVLKMLNPSNSASGFTLSWQSVIGKTYYLQRSTNLAGPAFSSVQSNIVGQTGTTSFLDPATANIGPCFYRVGVQ
jgi:hypothetical protein